MSQLLLRTFRELPLLTVLLSDPAGLLWGSSRGGGDGAGLAELSLTRYMSTTHVSVAKYQSMNDHTATLPKTILLTDYSNF